MKRFAAFLAMLLTAGVAYATCPAGSTCSSFDSFLNGLSAATTPTGTELVPCYQGSTTAKCTTAQVANLAAASGDVIASAGVATIQAGAVTLAKQSNFGASSLRGNATNSAATGQDLNPLAAANLMSAQIAAQAAINLTTGGDHAFGAYTSADGISLVPGAVVYVYGVGTGQTCGTGTNSSGTGGALSDIVCNGLWIVQSAAAWTRPINFPAGFVIAANCNLTVFIESGNSLQGHTFRISTSNATTINTSNIITVDASLGPATTTSNGTIKVTENGFGVTTIWNGTLPTAFADCASYVDAGAGLGDQGNGEVGTPGPCIVGDPNGHILSTPNSQSTPTITGTGCTKNTGSQDNSGSVAATGVDTCTITFGAGFGNAPFCVVSGYSATVLPFISTPPTTAAVVVNTAAAGTFSYVCM